MDSPPIDKKTLLAGYLNSEMKDEPGQVVFLTVDNLMHYVKRLWNAGCGIIVEDFTRKEMEYYLDSLRLCEKIGDSWRFPMDNFFADNEALLNQFSTMAARRVTLFIRLSAQLNYPYLLLSFMGFDCFYKF